MNYAWERLAEGVLRCRLPFFDVTVGLVLGSGGSLLIDTGTTLTEARAIDADVRDLTGEGVAQILLTHNHFDHILGSGAFRGAEIFCATEVAEAMVERTDDLRADAMRYGAEAGDVAHAIAALRAPRRRIRSAALELGGRSVAIKHPGRGHTDHDLIAVVSGPDRPVVFCGDLVEESGDPYVGTDSDLAAWPSTLERVIEAGGERAVFVPGHGAVVDIAFIRRQQNWLVERL